MLKKTIQFIDYDDQAREEDFRFNINKTELLTLDLKYNTNGDVATGLKSHLDRLVANKDAHGLMVFFEQFIRSAYGVKPNDSDQFVQFEKNQEIADRFMQSEAYQVLFEELMTDADAAGKFMVAVLPKKQP